MRMKPMFDLSIVIPALNEGSSIKFVLDEINEVCKSGSIAQSTEVIVIDDGSTDNTPEVIKASRKSFQAFDLRYVRHKQQLGQTKALSLGFKLSRGKVVVALDADGQNDPRDIPKLIRELLEKDLDCVSGWRKDRSGDRGLRVAFSRIANRVLAKASGLSLHDFGCTLKAYQGDLIRQIELRGDQHRIIPFQIHMEGGLTGEVPVTHRERFSGQSKYSLTRTFRVAQDIIVVYFLKRFATRPMHLLGTVGSLGFIVGLLGIVTAIFLKFFGVYDFVETPILLLSLVLVIGGINLLGTGLLAELTLREKKPQQIKGHEVWWSEG